MILEMIKGSKRNLVVLAIFVLINFLFAYKYFNRFTSYGLAVSIVYSGFIVLLYFLMRKSETSLVKNNFLFWGMVILYAGLHLILFKHIKVEQLNVDRWSIITEFWQNAFEGKYPYSAHSHMGNYPGPMPAYFLLALPFFLVHEIGYFSLLGFVGFAWFVRKHAIAKDSVIVLVLLMLSVAIFWEITVRSTILVNAVLFLFYLHWLMRIDLNKTKYFLLSAVLGGLLLATRSIFALVLVVYVVFMLNNKLVSFKRLFWWSTILLLVFIATFLPFLIFYFDEFLKINPFLVQSEFLFPLVYVPILLFLAGINGGLCQNKTDLFFWVGIVFFSVFVIYAIRICLLHSFIEAYMSSFIDLSYALFSLPFLLFSFGNKSTENIL